MLELFFVLFKLLSGANVEYDELALDVNNDGYYDNKDVVSLFRALSTESLPERVEDNGEDNPSGEVVMKDYRRVRPPHDGTGEVVKNSFPKGGCQRCVLKREPPM